MNDKFEQVIADAEFAEYDIARTQRLGVASNATPVIEWIDPRGRIPGDILIVAFPESNHRFRPGDEVTVLQVAPLPGFSTLANYEVIRHPARPGSTGHWIPSDYFQTN